MQIKSGTRHSNEFTTVDYETEGPFVITPCPFEMKHWDFWGKETIINCGSYNCRTCSHHCPMPLAEKKFACYREFDMAKREAKYGKYGKKIK